uniref:PDZ and LIM domain protein 5-like n=1 Tax=Cyprinus carpio TaxID=7962 RepID=A0A8C1QML9_CYPCA
MSGKYSVVLQGPAPWGFRLQGGKDFNMPLSISRLSDGGKAAKAGVAVGDLVLSIDGISTDGMNHLEAQNKIKSSTDKLNLSLQKASSRPKPDVAPKDDSVEIIKPVPMTTSIPSSSDITNSTHITSSSNRSARPFGGAASSHIASIPSAVSAFAPTSPAQNPNPQAPPTPTDGSPNHLPAVPRPSVYNTPINLYSNENACEVAMGQRRGLLESQGESFQLNGRGLQPQNFLVNLSQRQTLSFTMSRLTVMPARNASWRTQRTGAHGQELHNPARSVSWPKSLALNLNSIALRRLNQRRRQQSKFLCSPAVLECVLCGFLFL